MNLATRSDVIGELRKQSLEFRIAKLQEGLKTSKDLQGDYEILGTFPRHVVLLMKESGTCKRVHFIDKDGVPVCTYVEDLELPPETQAESADSFRDTVSGAVGEIMGETGGARLRQLVSLIGSKATSESFVGESAVAQLKSPRWWTNFLDENTSIIESALSGKLQSIEEQKPCSRFKPGQEIKPQELAAVLTSLKDMVKGLRSRVSSTTESLSSMTSGQDGLDHSIVQFQRLIRETSEDLGLVEQVIAHIESSTDIAYKAESYEALVPVVSKAIVATEFANHLLGRVNRED